MAKKKKRDIGHEETEKVLAELEKRIAKEYSQAEEELTGKLEKYIINTGDFSGARWKEMRDTIAQDLSNTDQIARSIAYGYMPEVYAINHNYGTYQVERESRIKTSYTMYDKHTVQRLFNDDNTFYHGPGQKISAKIKMGKTVAWNKRQVQSVLTQYVLQGESVQALAKRLRNTVGDSIDQSDLKGIANLTARQMARVLERKNKNAAIRNARTMATGVQNAGRIDAYKRAENMGIEMEKEWLAVMDGRTRHEHRILDGQHVPVDKDFEVGGYKIKYPGDPSADACMIYNCRCTLVPRLAIEEGKSNKNKMHNGNPALGNMSYDEWKYQHVKAKDMNEEGGTNRGVIAKITDADSAYSYEELKTFVGENLGMEIDGAISELNLQSVKESIQGIQYVQEEFPNAKEYFSKISVFDENSRAVMKTSFDGVISFNKKKYLTRESALKCHENKKRTHPEGYNCYTSGYHESAHILTLAIIDKRTESKDFAIYCWNESIVSRELVDKAYSKLYVKSGKYRKLSVDDLRSQISTYAMKNYNETIAEAVSDYCMNGEKSAPLSGAIWEVLKEELG